MDKTQYERLYYLNDKISQEKASDEEKDEYVRILRDNGTITNDQYDKYLQSKNGDDLLKIILLVGGIALLAYIISKGTND
ncbi:hypothetical protein CGC54_10165 [Capnocytophaga canimorsus]|uniref:Uncharacterized protein n=1 Tax=Capnocytophaga canimorsus TaxID=28188 RepID=A0AAC9Z4H3_9FLAO|nr:hypothetical protein [Capnocytophaga canimorsus]ATA94669.1 hypothetical protein CGC54_10165 [Capnocytophaga canimorsus]